ncbi:MAG: prolyl oligopeptidase family serine peptidase, partial [Verrucomicrobiae bacterium]|nr:prolyl oligopeptidase family serine peptidase [Verrucomicrobiae bacterium]
ARHGYVCLVVDTLQLGEIAGVHHGTYREERWWWHSRGYTPAGVECWNGIRGIDYLVSRPDVDPDRIAVTGISGGGAATFWIAAADERVTAAVPVSGMADLPSYVNDRVVNEHCDCMFLYNTYQWPWTRIACRIAPRPLLFTNSDQDGLFPMDANDRVISRLERLYSLYGRSDFVDAMVSIGGHAYRRDLRQAAYRFINTYLEQDPREVMDSERDLITGQGDNRQYPIPMDQLRVFPSDADLPADELNSTIDRHFVPMAEVAVPEPGQFESWREALRSELRRVSFRAFPERVPAGRFRSSKSSSQLELETEPGIVIHLSELSTATFPEQPARIVLGVGGAEADPAFLDFLRSPWCPGDAVWLCEPRGLGATRWTRRNPPNYVERSHVLIGQTVDTGRVRDIIATVRALRQRYADPPDPPSVVLVGCGAEAVLAAYAALWEPDIEGLVLQHPMLTHMAPDAPQFLNVLRVCDVPDVLGMLAPRGLRITGVPSGEALAKTESVYRAAGAAARLQIELER